MKHLKLFSACLIMLPFLACTHQGMKVDTIENKVEELLGKMTLQEKIGQMNQLSRMGTSMKLQG